MHRRSFLTTTLAGVSSLLADRLPTSALPLDAEPLGQIGFVLGRLRRLDVREGAASVLMPAHWLAARLTRALGNTPPPHPLHQPLATLAADAAELAGWVSFETGDYSEALHWYDCTIRAAREARDPDFTAFAGQARAWVLFQGLGDTKNALGQLDDIQLDGVSGQIRALVHGGRARALAVDGREKASLRAIDQAIALATDDGPSWAGWCGSPGQIELERGLTLVEIGQAQAAYDVLKGSLRRLPARLRRVAGTSHRGLAQAALLMGEPVQASGHILEAHRILAATGSRQLITVRAITRDLQARFGDVREVRTLPDQLRTDTRYVLCRPSDAGKTTWTKVHLRSCKYANRGGQRPWPAADHVEPADLATSPLREGLTLCARCLPT